MAEPDDNTQQPTTEKEKDDEAEKEKEKEEFDNDNVENKGAIPADKPESDGEDKAKKKQVDDDDVKEKVKQDLTLPDMNDKDKESKMDKESNKTKEKNDDKESNEVKEEKQDGDYKKDKESADVGATAIAMRKNTAYKSADGTVTTVTKIPTKGDDVEALENNDNDNRPEETEDIEMSPPSTALHSADNVRRGRATEPGALRVSHTTRRDDDDDDEESETYGHDIEIGETIVEHPNENGLNDEANQDLIQAELVTENSDMVIAADAELLKDTDTPESKRRRRMIRFIVIALAVAAIVIAVVVSVVNRNDNGSNGADAATNLTDETRVPTTAAPTTIAPTTAPSSSPSAEPSMMPSTQPTSLSWVDVEQKDSPLPFDGSLRLVGTSAVLRMAGGNRFGSRVDIRDISNTTLGYETNTTTLVLIYFNRVGGYSSGAQHIPLARAIDVLVYLCDDDLMFCDYNARLQDKGFPSLDLYENNEFLALPSGRNLYGYDLKEVEWTRGRTADILDDSRQRMFFFIPENSFASVVNEEANAAAAASTQESMWSRFSDFSFEGMNEMYAFAPEYPRALVRGGEFFALGINQRRTSCATSCFPEDRGYRVEIRRFDHELVGDPIERTERGSLFSEAGIAIAADGTIVAISSVSTEANDTQGVTTDDLFSVNVYRLENSTWVPLGSTLEGSTPGDYFGSVVAMNDEGTLLIVSSERAADDQGRVNSGRVSSFALEDGEWVPFVDDVVGPAGSYFGTGLALHPTKNIIVVGAPRSTTSGQDTGEVFVYRIAGR